MWNLKDNAISILTAQANIGATSVTVAADNFPAAPFMMTGVSESSPGSGIFDLAHEAITVRSKSGTTFTCDALAELHPSGQRVELRLMSIHVDRGEAVVTPRGDWTSDTMNLKAAVASGKPVVLKQGTFKLDTSGGTECLLVTGASRQIKGYGMDLTVGSKILVRSTVPTTTDIIRAFPTDTVNSRGYNFSNFSIWPESGLPGRHAIHFDLNGAPGYVIASVFEELQLGPTSGRSVRLSNPVKTDGFFCSDFMRNQIWGGMQFERLGDSVRFYGNLFTATYYLSSDMRKNGVIQLEIISLVNGANCIDIIGNNITTTYGAMYLNGLRFRIRDNNIERISAEGSSPVALVHIAGTSSGTQNNNCLDSNQIYDIVAAIDACRLENCYRAKITNNHFQTGGGARPLNIMSSCNNVVLYPDNIYDGGSLLDSGVSTRTI